MSNYFNCPSCGKPVSTVTNENVVTCTECGVKLLHPRQLGGTRVAPWRQLGFGGVEILAVAASGFSPTDVAAWIAAGVPWFEIAEWIDRHFTPSDAIYWLGLDVFSAADAENWRAMRGRREVVERVVLAGFGHPSEVERWSAAGFTADEMASWRSQVTRAKAPTEYQMPSGANGTLHDIREWKLTGISADKFAGWETGFDAASAAKWFRAGFTCGEAEQWSEAVGAPELAAKWRTVTRSWSKAARLIEAGVDVQTARYVIDDERRAERGLPPKPGGFARAIFGPNCRTGRHAACDDLQGCACLCHCWHAQPHRPKDEAQPVGVGSNPPHFMLGTERSPLCRDEIHRGCAPSARCRCECHCAHFELGSGTK
jgi:DNA-directed RNA polymerase subunit RPC12/RpoP